MFWPNQEYETLKPVRLGQWGPPTELGIFVGPTACKRLKASAIQNVGCGCCKRDPFSAVRCHLTECHVYLVWCLEFFNCHALVEFCMISVVTKRQTHGPHYRLHL